MKERIRRWGLLPVPAALLVLLLTLSGCTAGQQITGAEIIEKMRETMRTTQTVHGAADLSLNIRKQELRTLIEGLVPGGFAEGDRDPIAQLPDTASASVKFWKEKPDKARLEVTQSSLPGIGGATAVYDGQTVYAYDPAHNSYYTGTPGDLENLPEELRTYLESADPEAALDRLLNATTQQVEGTEQVAGLEAYKVVFTPQPDIAERLELPEAVRMQAGVLLKDAKATLWVDKDRWIPLKVVLEHPNAGSFTYTATEVRLNEPIDGSLFTLPQPEGSRLVNLNELHRRAEQMAPKATTLPQAVEAAKAEGWTLLEPSYVPEGATLIEVLRVGSSDKASGFVLNYSSPSLDFSIAQGRVQLEKGLGDQFSGRSPADTLGASKQVELRGTEALAFTPERSGWTSLIWQEKESGVWVAIRGKMELEEAVKVAEGLK